MNPSRFITVPSGLVILFLTLPVAVIFGRSLFDAGALENFLSVFSDPRQIGLFCKSLGIAAGAALISLIMGLTFAFLQARTQVPGKTLWKWIYLVPLCIPPFIHTNSWIYLLGRTSGAGPYGIAGTCLILAFSYYPFVALVVLSGLYGMDQQFEDAALLVRKPFHVFTSVTLPLVSPHIMSGGIFVFIFSLFNYGVPALLGVHTYPIEIFAQFSAFYDEGKALALSFPLLLTSLLLLLFQRHIMGKRQYVSIHTNTKNPATIPLHSFKIPASLIMGAIILVSVILPIGVLIFQARAWESITIAFSSSYGDMFTTLVLSMISATIIICLSFLMAGLIENQKYRFRTALDIATFILFAFPSTVVGIALIYFWNNPFLETVYKGPLILIIAYITLFLPFSIRVMTSTFKQISPGMTQAAVLCGKSWWERMSNIDLPLTIRGIAAGWVIAFILCMGELGATLLVIPPGQGTVSLKIYTLMHYGANQIVAALALFILVINLLMSLMVTLFVHRTQAKGAGSW